MEVSPEAPKPEPAGTEGDGCSDATSAPAVVPEAGPRVVPGWPADPIWARLDGATHPADRRGLDSWLRAMLWVRHEGSERRGGGVWFTPSRDVANLISVLVHDPRWFGVVGRNSFAERDEIRSAPPWHPHEAQGAVAGPWTDADVTRLRAWFARAYAVSPSVRDVEQAVGVAAAGRPFHPVRDYLTQLRWDGSPRLDAWLATYAGAIGSTYATEVGRRWMISAVARVMSPGCQVDCTLILESRAHGTGKTSAFRALVPELGWFSETGITLGDKDSYQNLHGIWLYLFDELDSLQRGQLTRTKNFLTAVTDHYRESYGRRSRHVVRQNVFCGSTNESQYLPDQTGNRRFWPVRVLRPIDVDGIRRDRDQLWAEAMALYTAGQPWHVDNAELRTLCEEEASARTPADPWSDRIAAWLERPTELTVDGFGRQIRKPMPVPDGGWLGADILVHAIGKEIQDVNKSDETRVGLVLGMLGWERGHQRTEHGARVRRYQPSSSQTSGADLSVRP
ncbi:MAG TPA: virulence-associated E family protein [Polyangiaceae bacterium]